MCHIPVQRVLRAFGVDSIFRKWVKYKEDETFKMVLLISASSHPHILVLVDMSDT